MLDQSASASSLQVIPGAAPWRAERDSATFSARRPLYATVTASQPDGSPITHQSGAASVAR